MFEKSLNDIESYELLSDWLTNDEYVAVRPSYRHDRAAQKIRSLRRRCSDPYQIFFLQRVPRQRKAHKICKFKKWNDILHWSENARIAILQNTSV